MLSAQVAHDVTWRAKDLHGAHGLSNEMPFGPMWSLAPGSSLPDGLSLSSTGHITGTPTKAGTYSVTVSVNDPVLKRYTIVIDAATGTNGNGSEPISATGAPVESMTAVAAGSIFAGFLLMVGAGLIGRRPGRHRVRS